ncbi:MAG: glycosyltransferase [Betaproteobacteria bacterium]|nr:glycosyltransferase [Betaproteobacteria bacterium]
MVGPRVSIFLPSLAGGGAERSIATVASGLAARGAQVSLVLASAHGPYIEAVNPAVKVVELGVPSMLRALPRLVRHLRNAQPDALLAAMSHANVAAALAHRLARSRARLVLSERVHVTSMLSEYRGASMRATYALMRWTYPWADQVVAVSDGVAIDLRRHIDMAPERIVRIYNPVVDEPLRIQAQATPAHDWLNSAEVPVVLAAGRLIAQKDFATLIDAFALVRRKRPVRLLILGEGELRESLLARAARLGVADDVSLPGFDSDPFAAMRASQVFVLSSRFEGLPGVLIQAMACGARVVSTDCPSGPREILEGGRWGALVPVGDVAALSCAIEAALDDPAPPDVRERAEAFTVESAVDGYARALALD